MQLYLSFNCFNMRFVTSLCLAFIVICNSVDDCCGTLAKSDKKRKNKGLEIKVSRPGRIHQSVFDLGLVRPNVTYLDILQHHNQFHVRTDTVKTQFKNSAYFCMYVKLGLSTYYCSIRSNSVITNSD